MSDNPNLMNEKDIPDNWVPLNSAPMIPGAAPQGAPAPPAPHDMPQFFSGSLAPQLQHDSSFVSTRPGSPRIPQTDLMPLGIQATPLTNSAIQSTSRPSPVAPTTITPPSASTDDDSIVVNPQTGVTYTVQQSDFNKLISIQNAAGGNIYLPPIASTVGVSVNNRNNALFNSGNTTVVGLVATSVATITVTGKPINAGDFLLLFIRNIGSPSPSGVASATMSDTVNGAWSEAAHQDISHPAVGSDRITLLYVQVKTTIAVGGTFTATLVSTYIGTPFNPGENMLFNMTGLKVLNQTAKSTGTIGGGLTFSSGGFTTTDFSAVISCAENDNGGLNPRVPGPDAWNDIFQSGSTVGVNYRSNVFGSVNDVYTNASSGGPMFADIMVGFLQTQPNDIAQLSGNFFCYVQNTGAAGTYTLKSALPIDGSTSVPVTLAPGQGLLLVYSPKQNGWFTERGDSGGGIDTDFYQTIQQAGASKPQESKLNFLDPITAVDNAGNGSTDITVPDMVGDSGTGGKHGLVPAPGAGDAAANKFLKANGSFAVPPTMVGDSGAGGTAGYAPAPGAGDNAAGKFLSAGGTYQNPGSNPTSFNTGLAYAIAAGYALG